MSVKTGRRVARSAPCPCGSGKKYKRCCWNRDHPFESNSAIGLDLRRGDRMRFSTKRSRQNGSRRVESWQRVFCQVPLANGKFLVLTLAFSSAFVERNGVRPGRFLALDVPELKLRGRGMVMRVEESPGKGASDGELLLAIEHCHESDFGVMLYGKGELARQVMERRRERTREVVLVMEKPDGGRVNITLVRFLDWIRAHGAEVGKEIFLDLPEMGARGYARVMAINPSPPVDMSGADDPTGRLVTGTFRHSSGNVYDLKLESEREPIGVTATHPFWSVDRNGWVSAIDLCIGCRIVR